MATPTTEAEPSPASEPQSAGGGAPIPRGAQNSNMATAPRRRTPHSAGSPRPVSSEHDTTLHNVYGPLGYLKELFKRFGADQCASWAASLSFFALLSVAPILLCALAVLGYLLHNPHEAAARVQHIIENFVPGRYAAKTAADIVAQMNIEKSAETLIAARGVAGVVGVVSLFWAALQIFVNAVAPMNAAFRAQETRNWFLLRVDAFVLLIVTGLLFLLSLVPSSVSPFVDNIANWSHFGGKDGNARAALMIGVLMLSFVLAILINSVMFAVIYRFLPSPKARVSWRAAWFSSLIIATPWEVAKRGFGLYLQHFANYNKLYGSLGGLVALIFWIYYSSLILLLGAEIAGLFQDALRARQTRQTQTT